MGWEKDWREEVYDRFRDTLLAAVEYSGGSEPGVKAISASGLGDDLLPLWLRYKYGVFKPKEISAAELGSILDVGTEFIFDRCNHDIDAKPELEPVEIGGSGWKLTGSPDLLDTRTSTIIDVKMTKSAIVKHIVEEKDHGYRYQLNTYRYLLEKQKSGEYHMALALFFKDAGFDYKENTSVQGLQMMWIDRMDDDHIEQTFLNKVKALEYWIEKDEAPHIDEEPMCDRYHKLYKVPGQPWARCHLYCSYKDVCPYASTGSTFTKAIGNGGW